jgi:hypothetical protein
MPYAATARIAKRATNLARERQSLLGRAVLALIAAGTLAACADEPSAPGVTVPTVPNLAVADAITVTNASGGTEAGSLRWAVAQVTDGGVIRFAPELAGDTITVDAPVMIAHPVTIEGPADKGVTISGDFQWHIFDIQDSLPSATTLRNLELVNGVVGFGTPGGGGVIAHSDVVLENVTIAKQRGDYAALFAFGKATLINTTISGNLSDGMAAFVDDQLVLVNSTIAHNSNGGISLAHNTLIRNSIIALNGAGPNCDRFFFIEYSGRSLSNDATCGDAPAVLVGGVKIDSLRYNGGPARTHALTHVSPAINAGKDCSVKTDERNVARDASCDIGAFEFTDFTTATVTTNASLSVDPSTGWVMAAGSVKCSRSERFDLTVEVKQEQRVGRATGVVQAAGQLVVNCTTTAQPWGIALAPVSGVFANGSAVVKTQTENSPASMTPSTVSTPVKLFWGHK